MSRWFLLSFTFFLITRATAGETNEIIKIESHPGEIRVELRPPLLATSEAEIRKAVQLDQAGKLIDFRPRFGFRPEVLRLFTKQDGPMTLTIQGTSTPIRQPPTQQANSKSSTGIAKPKNEGKKLFQQHCADCHGGSTPIAPDLTNDLGPVPFEEKLADPFASVHPAYRQYQITFHNGLSTIGTARPQGPDVHLADDTGSQRVVNKRSILRMWVLPGTIMPPGIADDLTPTQIADLKTFLEFEYIRPESQ